LKTNLSIKYLPLILNYQVCIENPDGTSTKIHKLQTFGNNHSDAMDILVEALSDFYGNLSTKNFFMFFLIRNHFFYT
jgi:hypothetical protein